MKTPINVGFNGAAACWRRKVAGLRDVRRVVRRFNGAAACWRRKVPNPHPTPFSLSSLQWGRRLLAAESHGVRPLGARHRDASMGPPLVGGGKKLDLR